MIYRQNNEPVFVVTEKLSEEKKGGGGNDSPEACCDTLCQRVCDAINLDRISLFE